jgi:peptidyl-prolyl cis-trans isomerase D
MLDSLLKKSGSVVVKVLLGLLILSFAVWGIGDVISPNTYNRAVVTVGGRSIQQQEFSAAYQREIQRLQPIFGNALDREQARNLGIAGSVLNSLIENVLFDLESREVGVTISDDLIRQQIANNGAFRGATGAFDRNIYLATLRQAGMTEQGLVADIRNGLSRAHLMDAIEGADRVPTSFVEPLYRYQNEKRVAETVRIADDSMPDPGTPDETALAAFHKDNEAQFTAPEYRKVTYVSLAMDEIAKGIMVADDRLRQAYTERQVEFEEPERRQVDHMLLLSEDDAKKAAEMIAQGKSFADAAKEVANADASTLDLGTLTKRDLSMQLPEIAEATFAAKEGEITAPVKSPIGWHLMKVGKVEAGRVPSFDEVKDRLRDNLARDQAIDVLYDKAKKLEDALGGGATLEEAASKLDLKAQVVAAVDASGRDPAGAQITSLPPGPRFVQTAFETPEQVESVLTEADQSGYFILRVDAVTPPAVKPIDQIRDQVVAGWKAQKRSEAAKVAADKALADLKEGKDIAAVASGLGSSVMTPDPFTRTLTEQNESLPQALASALFRAKVGDAVAARSASAYHVARLKEIKAADPATDKEGVELMSRQLANELKDDLRSQFANALQTRYPIAVNNDVLEQLLR